MKFILQKGLAKLQRWSYKLYKLLIDHESKGTQEDTTATQMESEPVSQGHWDKLEWVCDAGARRDRHFGAGRPATSFDCSGGGR